MHSHSSPLIGRFLPLAATIALMAGTASFGQTPPAPASGTNASPEASSGSARARPKFDPERVHDPSTIVTVDGVHRAFSTGPGIPVVRESPTGKWLREGRIFEESEFPSWHGEKVPGNRGHLWAPDVIRMGDKYFVYYSVSTFGKNTSAIGLVVGSSMDPSSSKWKWEDHGPVILSTSQDRFNAIDPAIFRDADDGSLWMTFGSFWDGIHMIELDPETGMRRVPSRDPLRLAWAPEIEAPFLHERDGFYYLFINWGKCCRGLESTYEIRVGRSRTVQGPYVDRDGVDLLRRGGTLVLATDGRWIGPGHASIHERAGREWLVHHYYDREAEGRPRMRMVPLTWDAEGWPQVKVEE